MTHRRNVLAATLFLLLPSVALAQDLQQQALDSAWQFRLAEHDPAGVAHAQSQHWQKASVPGTVQTDLMALHQLDDPFYRDNESKSQWVGLSDWDYRTTFTVNPSIINKTHVELLLQGLDTFADVLLNGHPLVTTDNMFRQWRVPVKSWLKDGSNELIVKLHSPIRHMQPWLLKQPYAMPGAYDSAFGDEPKGWNTATYVRTAQYQYGWDWGPRLVAEGIWQSVQLQGWDELRLDDIHIQQERVSAQSARLQLQLDVQAEHAGLAHIHVQMTPPGVSQPMTIEQDAMLDVGDNSLSVPLHIDQPKLWYPAGYGDQPLYHFHVTLSEGNKAFAVGERTTGIRRIELRRQTDAWGRSFSFVVNGVPIFAKGANIIPLDSFPNRVTPARHRALLEAASNAHMNMLRVWGGGYYESDDFYDDADRLGILIWQDFMFGGAIMPPDPLLRENARIEATEQVKRLRDHPSIALWSGNNEVQSDWESWAGTQDFKKALSPDERERVWVGNVVLFDSLLRGVVDRYDRDVPYWATSPGTDMDGASNQLDDGDYHSWKVWAGSAPIEDYLKDTPRFLSEFGLQSFPEMRTIDGFTAPQDRQINSPVMEVHQKFGAALGPDTGNKRLLFYINKYYGEPKDFASFVYLSQLMQAEGVELAAVHMRASRPHGMGVLFWQLNDVWPAASWSSIDYMGRWKALQFHARRFYNPLLIASLRTDGNTSVSLVSDSTQALSASWRVRVMDFDGNTLWQDQKQVTLAPLAADKVADYSDAALLHGADPRHSVAVFELSANGVVQSRSLVWFDSAKNLQLTAPQIVSELQPAADGQGYQLKLTATHLARGVWVAFGDLDATLQDNAFDLLAGETRTISIQSNASLGKLRQATKLTTAFDAIDMRK